MYFKKCGLTNIGIKSPTPIQKKRGAGKNILWFGKSSECPELHFWILQFYSSECSVSERRKSIFIMEIDRQIWNGQE